MAPSVLRHTVFNANIAGDCHFLFSSALLITPITKRVGGRPASTTGRKIDEVAPNVEKKIVESELGCRFVYVFRCLHFPILAVPLLNKSCFFYLLRLRQIYRESPSGSALRNPVGAKMAHQIDQVAPKGFHFSSFSARLSAFMKPNASKTPPKRSEVWLVDDLWTLPGPILNNF